MIKSSKGLFVWLLASILSLPAIAQKIQYEFAAPNAIHHEAEITILAEKLPLTPAIFRMSRSSPGRYATHEFGKNVYNVKAYNSVGETLRIEKIEGDVYRIHGHKGTVKITYTLFANFADGTYSSVDPEGYHLNMPATFMWIKGQEKAPITLKLIAPEKKWKIATQLKPTDNPSAFTAPDLQYFMDSPIKVANLHIREWTVSNPGNKHFTFRLALEAEATENLIDNFTEKLKRVVNSGQAVFGEFPNYDYGTYTFIASINPYVARGDGMEHRNSTMITIKRNFDGSDGLLSVFAHEFFHCWNVERIRPKSLNPFNFEKSNMSEALWIAEGFTHYYGDVLLVRAGLLSHSQFQVENSKLVNAMNTPGAEYYSPIENSQAAVFTDAGVSFDRTNYANMFTSYYTYGGAIAFALDLDLRNRFSKSLDDIMRELWRKFGRTEISYTLTDVQNTIASVTGNDRFAADFFKNHVYNNEAINFNDLLEAANYTIQAIFMGKAWMGDAEFITENNELVVVNNMIRNTPLYLAGIDIDDAILELDGKKMQEVQDVSKVINQHKPGDKISLFYRHRNKSIRTTIILKENPVLQIVSKKGELSVQQQTFREKWMGRQ